MVGAEAPGHRQVAPVRTDRVDVANVQIAGVQHQALEAGFDPV